MVLPAHLPVRLPACLPTGNALVMQSWLREGDLDRIMAQYDSE